MTYNRKGYFRESFANILENNNSVRAIKIRESRGCEQIFHSIEFSNRERKEKEGCSLVLIPGRLLHIHKFCTECQPPVVMLRPRGGRPGRLLAYFDDISASAVSPPLPLLLLLLPALTPPFLSFTRICIISFNYCSFCSAFNGSTTARNEIVSKRWTSMTLIPRFDQCFLFPLSSSKLL